MLFLLEKFLANRLKNALSNVISPLQSTFILNRQIQDGALVVNEVLDLDKRTKRKCLLMKVNFKKY